MQKAGNTSDLTDTEKLCIYIYILYYSARNFQNRAVLDNTNK